jgi:tryptophan synthase alpha chain
MFFVNMPTKIQHMPSIRQTFIKKPSHILNVYFTAGHPTLDSTTDIIQSLANCGVDIIELGMPYSDPLADGLTIQKSSETALKNGQTVSNIFKQVGHVRKQGIDIPIILMGYYNQLLKYGVEKFLSHAENAGIQGLIVPDLPMDVYEKQYIDLFKKYNMEISFLITPMTSDTRIRQADRLSSSFVYVVSQSSITGKSGEITDQQLVYFDRIRSLQLESPTLIGFGIHNKATRTIADQYSNGVIIGSAFIRILEQAGADDQAISTFIRSL